MAPPFWQNIFLFGPSGQNSSYNPSGLFVSGFLQAAPWLPFLPGSSGLPFIGVGVAFLVMPCNEQSFASFLMLTQGLRSLGLELLLLRPHGWTAFCIILMPTHILLTPFSWGMPLELVFLYGYPQSTYWTGFVKVFLDQRGLTFMPWPYCKRKPLTNVPYNPTFWCARLRSDTRHVIWPDSRCQPWGGIQQMSALRWQGHSYMEKSPHQLGGISWTG